jgi:hypothetical protein
MEEEHLYVQLCAAVSSHPSLALLKNEQKHGRPYVPENTNQNTTSSFLRIFYISSFKSSNIDLRYFSSIFVFFFPPI